MKKEIVSLMDIRSRILSANFYPFASGQVVESRLPYVHVFVYISAGKGIVKIGDTSWKAVAGDLYYLAPGKAHRYEADEKDPMVHASVYVDLLSPSTPKLKGDLNLNCFVPSDYDVSLCASVIEFADGVAVPAQIRVPRNAAWLSPFLSVIESYPEHALGNDLLLRAYFESFFVRYLQYTLAEINEFYDPRIGKMTEELERSEASKVNVSEWARRMGISNAYLYELFRKQTGTSPQHYLTRTKLDKAKTYLRETNMLVTEIADRLGFSSVHYFARQFAKYAQEPATRYRQRFRGFL